MGGGVKAGGLGGRIESSLRSVYESTIYHDLMHKLKRSAHFTT